MSAEIAVWIGSTLLGATVIAACVIWSVVEDGRNSKADAARTRRQRISGLEHALDLLPCSDSACPTCRVRAMAGGDPRLAAYTLAVGEGLLTVNDIRRIEGLRP